MNILPHFFIRPPHSSHHLTHTHVPIGFSYDPLFLFIFVVIFHPHSFLIFLFVFFLLPCILIRINRMILEPFNDELDRTEVKDSVVKKIMKFRHMSH